MANAAQAWNLVAAWDHFATAAHYLARANWGSPPAALYGRHHRDDLGFGFDDARAPSPARYDHHRRRHDLESGFGFDDGADARPPTGYGHHHRCHELESDDDDDGADALPPARHGHRRRHHHELDDDDGGGDADADAGGGGDADADASGSGDGADADAGGDVEDDDFEFAVDDLVDLSYAVASCVPPYPMYRGLTSYRDDHPDGWTWLMFACSLIFTVAMTTCSVRVFRSSRRLLPTALRALLLGLTIVAQGLAASHLLPSSTLATGVSYGSIFIHVAVYILAWCLCCSAGCRRILGRCCV